VKQIRRLAASANLQNNSAGYITLTLKDFDGGPFDLQPFITEDAVILPDDTRPAYGIAITADSPDVLERFGKALLTVARHQKSQTEGDVPADE
jgi:hypothetical protein